MPPSAPENTGTPDRDHPKPTLPLAKSLAKQLRLFVHLIGPGQELGHDRLTSGGSMRWPALVGRVSCRHIRTLQGNSL
jgi:hypothetical protein